MALLAGEGYPVYDRWADPSCKEPRGAGVSSQFSSPGLHPGLQATGGAPAEGEVTLSPAYEPSLL